MGGLGVSANSIFYNAAHRVILSSGWRRALIAIAAGLAGSLVLAPIGFQPAFIVTMTVAVWLIDGCAGDREGRIRSILAAGRSAAVSGWCLGFGFCLGGFWWLGAAFLVEADKFAWALPLGVIGLPAFLGLFSALGFVIARLLWSSGAGRIFALATGLGLSEWLRGTIFTGFPWNDFGMALGGNLVTAQIASVVGLHGLAFIAIALAAAPATLVDQNQSAATSGKVAGLRYRPFFLAVFAFAAIVVFGAGRLASTPTQYVDGIQLRLMQPNLPQDEKFRADRGLEILASYIRLSDRSTSPQTAGVASATHLFWPESPFPFILSQNPEALAEISKFLPRGTTLITGAARAELKPASSRRKGREQRNFFNSIHVIEAGGIIVQTYDKVRLVPFGEFVPFANVLSALGIQQFVHIPGGFSPGPGSRTLNLPRIGVVSPMICYEAIFPGIAGSRIKPGERPQLLVNVTNDGWFGPTSGPYQHLAQARLRAIEEGTPLVRVANTGVSAVVDSVGRILHRLPLGEEGLIDAKLPKPGEATVFSTYRTEIPAFLALAFLLLALLLRRWRQA